MNFYVDMMTLFMVITQDGWVDHFQELQENGYFLSSAFFYGFFITIGPFVLVNVIIAIVVNNLVNIFFTLEQCLFLD
jgi:hypothetical protein